MINRPPLARLAIWCSGKRRIQWNRRSYYRLFEHIDFLKNTPHSENTRASSSIGNPIRLRFFGACFNNSFHIKFIIIHYEAKESRNFDQLVNFFTMCVFNRTNSNWIVKIYLKFHSKFLIVRRFWHRHSINFGII